MSFYSVFFGGIALILVGVVIAKLSLYFKLSQRKKEVVASIIDQMDRLSIKHDLCHSHSLISIDETEFCSKCGFMPSTNEQVSKFELEMALKMYKVEKEINEKMCDIAFKHNIDVKIVNQIKEDIGEVLMSQRSLND